MSKVRDLLSRYVGTHNFHNFTSGSKFEQMASNRFIMSFEVPNVHVSLVPRLLPAFQWYMQKIVFLRVDLKKLGWS